MMNISPYLLVKRSPPGVAEIVPIPIEGVREVSWIIRMRSERIREIKKSGNISGELRAGIKQLKANDKPVVVFTVMLGLGPAPFTDDSLFEAHINEYVPKYTGSAETLTTQEKIPAHLIGDSGEAEFTIPIPNTIRRQAQGALAAISRVGEWTRDEFDACLGELLKLHQTKSAVWEQMPH